MNHLVVGALLGVILALYGGSLIGPGGALFGFVLGLMAGFQIRLADRIRRLEDAATTARAASQAPVQPPAAEPAATVAPAAPRIPLAERLGAAPGASAPADAAAPAPEAPATQEPPPPPALGPAVPPPPRAPRAPSSLEKGIAWLKHYATTGNVVAKAGVLLLFFGVSFLLKYAIDRNALPVEVRLSGTAAAAIALIVTGWRLRLRSGGFGLVLQGGGIGLLYLTVFAAARLYGVLPMGGAFAMLLALVGLSALLAVRQDSPALATLGVTGGFLAPVLTSTGGGSHVALFGYYALLNAGILAIAWHKAWRSLNLTGFLFTFVIGAAWGYRYYRPEHFATVEPFLVLSFLFYVAVAVLFALRHPPRLKGYVDGTLVFGLPAVVFSLQAPLVRDMEFGRAWSALGMGVVYIGTAAWLRRRDIAHLGMLTEAFLALGVLAASLAVPFAFDGHLTAAAWALEGAGLVWIGVRQQRRVARIFGVVLQFAAGLAFFAIQADHSPASTPVFNAQYLGGAFVAAGALFASSLLARNAALLGRGEGANATLLLAWGLGWWLAAGVHEIDAHAPDRFAAALVLAFVAASGAALAQISRRIAWAGATRAGFVFGLLFALFALAAWTGDVASGPVEDARWAGWLAALAALLFIARRAEGTWSERALRAGHALLLWLALFLLAWAGDWALGTVLQVSEAWQLATWAAVCVAALVLLPAQGGRFDWPVLRFESLYLGSALLPVALFALAWTLGAATDAGDPWPLGWVPVLNPLDLGTVAVMLAVALWWRGARGYADALPVPAIDTWLPRALGALGFLWINVATARAVHRAADVPWSLDALHRSATFQGSLSVLWGSTALAVMVFATRRSLRPLWMCGATLLAALVLKLFFVDLGDRGTVARIVSFIAAGALMLLIGYLSPAPPRRQETPA